MQLIKISYTLEYLLNIIIMFHFVFGNFERFGESQNSNCTVWKEDGELLWNYSIPSNYNKHLPPKHNDGPVPILVSIILQGIPDISVEKMAMQVDLLFIITWKDCRLNLPRHGHSNIPEHMTRQMWTPSIYFPNGIATKEVSFTAYQDTLRLYEDSYLFYYRRKTVKFYCDFDLIAYPMDVQHCELQINPVRGKEFVTLVNHPIPQFQKNMKSRSPSYCILKEVKASNCTKLSYYNSEFSCIALHLTMERALSYYLIVTYIPSAMTVILSWISFWLDADASAPRVALGLTTLLTMTTQFTRAQRNLPPVPYVKALDVWMFACMFMIFSSLIQFAVVNYRYRYQHRGILPLMERVPIIRNIETRNEKQNTITVRNGSTATNRIDKLCRICFPLSFLVFNIFYWAFYLNKS